MSRKRNSMNNFIWGILGNIISPLISLVTNLLFSGIGSLFGF